MKKITSLLLVLVMMLSLCAGVSAHYISNADMGISFNLSNNWVDRSQGNVIRFNHSSNPNEYIIITAEDIEGAWSIEQFDEAELKAIYDEAWSDAKLAQNLSATNNDACVVTTNSVLTNYETINNVTYFRYEKSYTASGGNTHYDTSFYNTVYMTAKNGKVYELCYCRDYITNNFQDFATMLTDFSYGLGEIKITIDNQRIYPDTPALIFQGRTLVPIRAVAEYMNYTVQWDAENQIVSLISNDNSNILLYQIGNTYTLKNGLDVIIDVAPRIIGGRTYLPLRAVAEAMNTTVNWDAATRTVLINR